MKSNYALVPYTEVSFENNLQKNKKPLDVITEDLEEECVRDI